MINIKYKIEFFNEWHCGSGLSAGADVDALVIKDKNNLPYIPGKTIKGLVRQALEEIAEYKDKLDLMKDINVNFGVERQSSTEKENLTDIQSRGTIFFTNATLTTELSSSIIASETQEHLYRSIASTAINENGVAKKNSLRKIQTTIPCELHGDIFGLNKSLEQDIRVALAFIKRLGVSRNRGLGRCKFTIEKIEEVKA